VQQTAYKNIQKKTTNLYSLENEGAKDKAKEFSIK
jgi:hypothetical protein